MEKLIKDVLKWIIETKNTECLDVNDVDIVYKDYITERGDDAYALLAEVRADLIDIIEFGYSNPGCGFSCAKKAEHLLKKISEHFS